MTRQNRLLVILVAISAVGVAALWLLARQFQSRLPAAAAQSAAVAPAASAGVATGREAVAVDAYLAGRRASAKVLAAHPAKAKQVMAVTSGNYDLAKGQLMASNIDFVIAYKLARFDALTAAGSSEAEYESVRAAYRSWKGGGACDRALGGAFDAKRDDLAAVELGGLETFDDQVK